MKTATQYISILFVSFLLATSALASRHTPTVSRGTITSIEVTLQGQYCFVIHYSDDDLRWRKDIAMITDIEWSARENIPYYILEYEFINTQYYSPDGSPATLACYYYEEPLVILYY